MPAPEDQIEFLGSDRMEPIIFEIQIDDLPAVHTLRCQSLDSREEKKGFPSSPDTC